MDCKEEKVNGKRGVREVFLNFLVWRERHIKEKNFVLVLAFLWVFSAVLRPLC